MLNSFANDKVTNLMNIRIMFVGTRKQLLQNKSIKQLQEEMRSNAF